MVGKGNVTVDFFHRKRLVIDRLKYSCMLTCDHSELNCMFFLHVKLAAPLTLHS